MTILNITIAGSSGRMGRTLLEAVAQAADMRLAAALERSGSPYLGKDAGELRGRVEAYAKAGIQHAMLEPAERGLDDWLRAVERAWQAVHDIK